MQNYAQSQYHLKIKQSLLRIKQQLASIFIRQVNPQINIIQKQINSIEQKIKLTLTQASSNTYNQDLEKNLSDLYNELIFKDSQIQKYKKVFNKRLQSLQILLFQKDYKEALQKIDAYKKNSIDFESENVTTDITLRSVNDIINQAFYNSEIEIDTEIKEQINHIPKKLQQTILDDIPSDKKQQIIYQLWNKQEYDEQLHDVTLQQIMKAKNSQTNQAHQFMIQLMDDYEQQNNIQTKLKNKYLDEQDRKICNETPNMIKKTKNEQKNTRVETGKKKYNVNQQNMSGLNLISQIFISETGKKSHFKRQRSLTLKKGDGNQDKKCKTFRNQKETQKKLLKKNLLNYKK